MMKCGPKNSEGKHNTASNNLQHEIEELHASLKIQTLSRPNAVDIVATKKMMLTHQARTSTKTSSTPIGEASKVVRPRGPGPSIFQDVASQIVATFITIQWSCAHSKYELDMGGSGAEVSAVSQGHIELKTPCSYFSLLPPFCCA